MLWCFAAAAAAGPSVRLRWSGEPPVAAYGQLVSGSLEVTALTDTTVSRFHIERAAPLEQIGAGHSLVSSDAASSTILGRGARLAIAFQVEMGDPLEPLVLCVDADGASVCRPIRLSAETAAETEGTLIQVVPPPGVAPSPPPPAAAGAPESAASSSSGIRVHGKLVYDRLDRREPFRAVFRPKQGTFASFWGQQGAGNWILRIENSGDTSGSLRRWSLGVDSWTVAGVDYLSGRTWRTIPPHGSVDSIVAVSKYHPTVYNIAVLDLDIAGARLGDLRVSLLAPSGSAVVLMDADGADSTSLGDTKYRYEGTTLVEVGRATAFSDHGPTSIGITLANTPAAGVRVKAQGRCHSTGGPFFTQASIETNAAGDFDFPAYWGYPCTPDVRIEVESTGTFATVENYITQINYRWSTTYSDFSGSDLEVGWIKPDTHIGAINIMNVIWRAARWLSYHRFYDMAHVDVQWPAGWPAATSWYVAAAEEILIRSGDARSDTTVLHEYGHFWMDQHSYFPTDYGVPHNVDSDYCNGMADDCSSLDPLDGCLIWNCGHTTWCAETPVIAWHEGFANWFADVISRDFEKGAIAGAGQGPTTIEENNAIYLCRETGQFGYPPETEGFLSALLRDIEDDDPPAYLPADDHRGYAFGEGFYDALRTGPDLIFDIAEQNDPPQRPSGFLSRMAAQHPELQPALWETARHAGYETDGTPPGLATNLASTTNPTGTLSTNPSVFLYWSPAPDDLSGVGGYAVTVSENGPAMPVEEKNVFYGTYYTSDALPPGTYYLNVRAVDRAGNWSPGFASYGPVIIVLPVGSVSLLQGVRADAVTWQGDIQKRRIELWWTIQQAWVQYPIYLSAGSLLSIDVRRGVNSQHNSGTLDPGVELFRAGQSIESWSGGGSDVPPGPGDDVRVVAYPVPASDWYRVRIFAENDSWGPFVANLTVTAPSGQSIAYTVGEAGGSSAWGDTQDDGRPDLFVTRGRFAAKLFYNSTNDANAAVFIENERQGPAAWGDYDADGKLDLYVGSCPGANHLYHGEGSGSFSEATVPLLEDAGGCARSVAWVDFDGDGDLDLHVVNGGMVSGERVDRLFRNDGGGAWSRVASSEIEDPSPGVAGVWGDYDDDGDADLFLANEGDALLSGPLPRSKLLRNDGGGVFTNVTAHPLDALMLPTSAVWADLNGDLRLDLAVVSGDPAGPAVIVYWNEGFGSFSATRIAPLGSGEIAAGDIDGDGDLDLFAAGRLLRNDGSRTSFSDITTSLFPLETAGARAFADVNRDGRLDLGGLSRVWWNGIDNGNHWLELRLPGLWSAFGYGARVTIYAGGRWQIREVSGGGRPGSQDDAVVHFGLGAATTVDEIRVRWSNGMETRLGATPGDQRLSLPPPDLTLSVADVSVLEGNSGAKSAVFTIRLAAPSVSGNTRVDWATEGGGATAGVDFSAASGTAVFPLGATQVQVPVAVYGDTLPEPDERFDLVLSKPMYARIVGARAAATIQNDDGAPPSVAIGAASVQEGDSGAVQLVFPLTLSVPAPQAISVTYALSGGNTTEGRNATEGRDYQGTSGTLSFPLGATTALLSVPVLGDTDIEFDETVIATLTGAMNATVAFPPQQSAIGTILDDDAFRWNLPVTPAASVPSPAILSYQNLGYSVASAGDVNKDGYPDLIVGAPLAGRAYLYLGSATGIASTPAWIAQGTLCDPLQGSFFGHAVASAGDVNKDGYADVIVGAPGCARTLALYAEGAVFVYLGGPSGLATTPHWYAVGNVANSQFGWSVASAGDVNKDGASDVIVGSPFEYFESGRIFVWLGASGTGLGASGTATSTADWIVMGGTGDRLGFSVSSAGDVNKDGYADVAAVASKEGCTPDSFGCAHIWNGGGTGTTTLGPGGDLLLSGVDATLWGSATSIAAAGDVNGDGYGDVVLGNLQKENARLFLGSATGLVVSAAWTAKAPGHYATFGYAVAGAGDVNHDGFADLLVGAREPGASPGQWGLGRAFLYLGSPDGPTDTPVWIVVDQSSEFAPVLPLAGTALAGAGDLNKDGYADLVIGSPGYGASAPGQGAFFVYHGGPTSFVAAPKALVTGQSAPAGDVNGDGYADVLSLNKTTRLLSLFLGGSAGYGAVARWSGTLPGTSTTFTLAAAGDVNGDSYGDVLVGLPDEYPRGVAYLYLGAPSGLGAGAAWTALSEQVGDRFGFGLASAGDVNADGFADVLVGAPEHAATRTNGGFLYEGKAYLYLGSPSGLSGASSWSFQGEQTFSGFGPGDAEGLGASVASAGDVNHDGYTDVIVGCPSYDIYGSGGRGDTGFGRSYVFYGAAYGLGAQPVWIATYDKGLGLFGQSVAGAGDVNGDGFGDVLVGSPQSGRAWLWYGDPYFFNQPDGLPSNADWLAGVIVPGYAAYGGNFGETVAGVGDVNGDGYADVATVSPGWSSTANRIFVYLGSQAGLTRVPVWIADGPVYATDVAAAGDVNADGYADVLAGGRLYLGGFEIGATLLPRLPASLTQNVSNGIVTIGGTVGDAGGGNVRLEIELRRLDESFTGEPTDVGAFVPSGTPVTFSIGALPNGKYAWRSRTARASGVASPWSDFGGTGASDFTLSDTFPPALTPSGGGAHTTDAFAYFMGTASDPSGVLRVSWLNEAGGSGLASGTTSWSTGDIPLHAGANQIRIEAFDASGNRGVASHLLFRDPYGYGLPALLTVARAGAGSGRVTSNPAGIDCGPGCSVQHLPLARDAVVTLAAQADPGSIFTGFSGGPGCPEGVVTLGYPYTNACTASFEPASTYGAASEAWRTTRGGVPALRAAAMGVRPNGESIVAASGRNASGYAQIVTTRQRASGSDMWVATHTAATGFESAIALAVDAAGGAAVAGTAYDTSYDMLVLRYDAAGAEQWVRRYDGGSLAQDDPRAIAFDTNGNVIVTGGSAGDWATVKWSPNGTQLWAVLEEGGTAQDTGTPRAVAVDGAGNAYVTGESQGDLLVVAYDPNGNVLWRDRYAGPNGLRDVGTALALDGASGSLFVAGESEGAYVVLRYTLSGARRWLQRYPNIFPGTSTPSALAIDASRGRVIVTGAGRGDPGISGLTDFLTLAYTVDGAALWARRFDGSAHGDDGGVALALGSDGEVSVTGRSQGAGTSFDFVTLAYDTNGNELWIQRHGAAGASDDQPVGLGVDSLGAVTVAGNAGASTRVLRYVPASIDADRDTVPDGEDNCTLVHNTLQSDVDGDGYGNACDADLTHDGIVNFADLARLKAFFFKSDPRYDLNEDGVVNFSDLAILKKAFFKRPGPAAGKP